jgi:hypothetical protein
LEYRLLWRREDSVDPEAKILESDGVSRTSSIHAGPGPAVQFYEREEYLYSVVADFLARGLTAGKPTIVIATQEHRAAGPRNSPRSLARSDPRART